MGIKLESHKTKTRNGTVKGTARLISSHKGLIRFLERNNIKLSERYKAQIDKVVQHSSLNFYIDIEFCGSVVMEICVLNYRGDVILNTLIDHQCQVAELVDIACRQKMRWSSVKKISDLYGSSPDQKTHGMTVNEIVSQLQKHGFGKESTLIE